MQRTTARWRRLSIALLVGMLSLSIVAGVSAHETREVGDFEFVVGFMNEPAYVNELNGIDLRISYADSGDPVENAQESLNAVISYGEESTEVDLRARWGQPGAYTADVVPTVTGAYSFRFVGEIDGQEVDETFRAGPDTFSEIQDRDALEFPANPPSPADETDQAMAIGIAGVAAGLLGLVAGAAGYYKASNASGQSGTRAQQRRQSPPQASK
jgi:hypothetical protein